VVGLPCMFETVFSIKLYLGLMPVIMLSFCFWKYLMFCRNVSLSAFDLSGFFEKLSEYCMQYKHIILCGDLNIDLSEYDSHSRHLTDRFVSVGLRRVNCMPTRFSPNSRPSLLDVHCVADLDYLVHFEQLSLHGISDHDMLFMVYDIDFNRSSNNNLVTFRDFKNTDSESLLAEAATLPWNDCWFFSDVDSKVEHFTNLINYLFDKYVPLKVFTPRKINQPWFNRQVANAIKNRGKMHNRWRRNPTDHNWAEYRIARNRATSITNQAKSAYYQSKLDSNLPPKSLWQNLKSVGINNKTSKTCSIDADTLNTYFISSLSSSTPSLSLEVNENLLFNHGRRLHFSTCTESDILECFKSIKSNAIGEDGVSLKFLKIIVAYIVGPLTHIINCSLTSRNFPKLWKIATVIPVEKKKNATAPEHYRPISILSVLSKIYEKFIARQIVSHLKTHKLLTEYQSGFRGKHSCTTAMLKIVEDIRGKYDKGEITILVLLDFSKAFDSLNFEILLLC